MTATAGAPRLSRATLSSTGLPSGVQPPAVDPADVPASVLIGVELVVRASTGVASAHSSAAGE